MYCYIIVLCFLLISLLIQHAFIFQLNHMTRIFNQNTSFTSFSHLFKQFIMTRSFIFFALFFSFITANHAQAVRRYHQNLAITDASAIQVEAENAEVEIIKWEGSDILVEVTVTTKSGSTTILNHLQKEGRYDLAVKVENSTARLVNKTTKRQAIKVKGAEMDEQVKYQISVPDNYPVTNASATPTTEN
jgi:hypothetical protein